MHIDMNFHLQIPRTLSWIRAVFLTITTPYKFPQPYVLNNFTFGIPYIVMGLYTGLLCVFRKLDLFVLWYKDIRHAF